MADTAGVVDSERRRLAYERSACPREHFGALRAAGAAEIPDMPGVAILLQRSDVEYALRHWEDYSSELTGLTGGDEPLIPLNVDPPAHVTYRRLLDPYFAPKKMQLLQPAVQAHTNDLIDAFIERGSCDFSAEMAVPLPCSTFLSVLGLPVDELETLIEWKDRQLRPERVSADPDEQARLRAQAARDVDARMAAELADRRVRPRDDLISHLAEAELDGVKLTDSEILRVCSLMFTAGLDTVTSSLECIFAFLVEHDDARRMLVDEPGSEVTLVEELLRWETPVQLVVRVTTRDVTLDGGTVIAAGRPVLIGLASANADPHGEPGADTLDLRRRDIRNLAFGGGPHRCLGSNLARMELRTVVRTWHERIPEYALAPGAELTWNSSVIRGVDHLPLVWSR